MSDLGDVLTLTPRAMAIPGVQEAVALSPAYLPAWLTRAGGQGGVVSTPRRADIEADIREDLIVEFYTHLHLKVCKSLILLKGISGYKNCHSL